MAILTQILSNLSVSSVMLLWSVYTKHKVFLLNNLKPETFSQISFHFCHDLLFYDSLFASQITFCTGDRI